MMESTKPMRDRARELTRANGHDDYDRAVLHVLNDFDKLESALRAIVAEPFGCVFCDSGKLRNPAKRHDAKCGFGMAQRLLAD